CRTVVWYRGRGDLFHFYLLFVVLCRYPEDGHSGTYITCTRSSDHATTANQDILMQVNIRLAYQYGYTWFSRDGISVKGYAWNERHELLREDSLAAFFEQIGTAEDFVQQLRALNGLFSVIVQREDHVFFATDRT